MPGKTPNPPVAGSSPAAPANISVSTYYSRLAPFYDLLFGRMYRGLRRRSLAGLCLAETDMVVLIGVGTGLDFQLLPRVRLAVGIDPTGAMLAKARTKADSHSHALVLGDGGRLPLASASADAAVLHLVLSVASNPRAVFVETARVVRSGGKITVCDHLGHAGSVSWARRLATRLSAILGTRFDGDLAGLIAGLPVRVTSSERAWFGCYQVALLERLPVGLPEGI